MGRDQGEIHRAVSRLRRRQETDDAGGLQPGDIGGRPLLPALATSGNEAAIDKPVGYLPLVAKDV
jgi:hypothetical protein